MQFGDGVQYYYKFYCQKNIEKETYGLEQYRITIILSIAVDGSKLTPFVILKGGSGKTIENHLKNFKYDIKIKYLFFVRKRMVYN